MTALFALDLDFTHLSLAFLLVCFLMIVGGAAYDMMSKGGESAKKPKAKKANPEKKPKAKKAKKPKKKKEKKKKGKKGKDEEPADEEDSDDDEFSDEPDLGEAMFEAPEED